MNEVFQPCTLTRLSTPTSSHCHHRALDALIVSRIESLQWTVTRQQCFGGADWMLIRTSSHTPARAHPFRAHGPHVQPVWLLAVLPSGEPWTARTIAGGTPPDSATCYRKRYAAAHSNLPLQLHSPSILQAEPSPASRSTLCLQPLGRHRGESANSDVVTSSRHNVRLACGRGLLPRPAPVQPCRRSWHRVALQFLPSA